MLGRRIKQGKEVKMHGTFAEEGELEFWTWRTGKVATEKMTLE